MRRLNLLKEVKVFIENKQRIQQSLSPNYQCEISSQTAANDNNSGCGGNGRDLSCSAFNVGRTSGIYKFPF